MPIPQESIMNENKTITLETTVLTTLEKAWETWIQPQHVTQWNHASDDWHCPSAQTDLRVGGKFSSRMEAKDGSFGFDFWGIYDEIVPLTRLRITMGDDRKMEVHFTQTPNGVKVIERFETEDLNSAEQQREGWQAILDNYKRYTEKVTDHV